MKDSSTVCTTHKGDNGMTYLAHFGAPGWPTPLGLMVNAAHAAKYNQRKIHDDDERLARFRHDCHGKD
jgi:hypothetical protein